MERGDMRKQFENWVTMALTPEGRGELFEQLGFYYVVGSAMQKIAFFFARARQLTLKSL